MTMITVTFTFFKQIKLKLLSMVKIPSRTLSKKYFCMHMKYLRVALEGGDSGSPMEVLRDLNPSTL